MGDQVWTWRKLLTQREWTRSIGRGVRLVAWDLPGHGDSPEPPPGLDGDLQLRAQLIAQRLLGATQALGCGRDTVWVGNSFGGAIATWVALKRPDQVRGLVLLAPGGMRAQRLATLAKDTLATPTADSLREFRQRAYAKPQPDYPSWIWRAAAERAKRSPVSRILKVQQDEDDLTVPIHSLAVPTWVLWGKQDRILPLENGQGFREIPKASLREWREIEGCGHLPQKECSEDVFRVVLSAASA
jgi:pimeloyl-ACP methyl ester carboxylesterase